MLAVCTGNMCRSPLIASLLQMRSAMRVGERITCSSSGTRAPNGEPMDPLAAAELRRLGGTPEEHTSRLLRSDDFTSADIVITATRRHRSQVLTVSPQHLHRAFTLIELADLLPHAEGDTLPALVRDAARHRGGTECLPVDELDIPDPIGAPPEVHTAVADRIDGAVESIVNTLATVRPPL